MATLDPNVIGVADICLKCGWLYRRPINQTHRIYCRACETKQ